MEEWRKLLNLIMSEGLDTINMMSDNDLRKAMANE